MPQENVELARRVYEAFNRGDVDGMVAHFAPKFEYVPTGMIPRARDTYQGPEGIKEFVRWFWGEFDSAYVEVQELIEARDLVVASVILRSRGRHGGVQTSWNVWHVWSVRDGKIVRGQGYASRGKAIKAAGLSE